MKEIIELLKKFQQGYEEKNLENVNPLMAELFLDRKDLLTLGTGTNEVCIGHAEVTELIRSDWDGGWGDFKIDIDGAKIDVDGDIAWFYADCTVKYSFKNADDKEFNRHNEFIQEIIKNKKGTSKQKLSTLNWFLGLHYHQRQSEERDYLWPSELSGMLVKENGVWKIATLHFSIPKSNYPDERLEDKSDYDYRIGVDLTKNKIATHKGNQANDKVLKLLKELEDQLIGDNEFGDLHFDSEQVLVFDVGQFSWLMAFGTIKKQMSEDEIFSHSLQEIESLLNLNISEENKLFEVKRSVAYALKEVASGTEFTWLVRLTAVVQKVRNGYVFRQKHFSYPFDWIFEGKY